MSERILIKFQSKGDKRLHNSILRLAAAQAILTGDSKKLDLAIKKLTVAQGKLARKNRLLDNSFATLRSKMLLFSFAMSIGGRQLIQFGKQAAKVESMERAFTMLSGGTENSAEAFNKLRKATDGTMSQFDLFQQANNAMILGVTKNSDEMAEMFDIAQRLGNALGRDTRSSVESLITGIGRQSRLMLDNIGIIVKSEEAYEKFAAANKKTASALTDTEKKQAFLNAAMEAGKEAVELLGTEVLGGQAAFDRFSASLDDLQTRVGTINNEFLIPLINSLSSLLDSLDENKLGFDSLFESISSNNIFLTFFVSQIKKSGQEIKRLDEEALKATAIFAGLRDSLKSMTSSGLEKQLSVQEKVLKKLNEQNKNEEELSEKENLKLKRTKNLIETIKSYLSVLGDSSAEYNTYIKSEELLNKLFAKTNAGKIKNIKSQIQSLDLLNKETKGTDEYRLVMNKLQQDLDKLVPNLGRMRIDIEAIQNFRQKDFNKGLFSDDFLENVRKTSKNITIIVETLDPFAVTIQQTQQQMVSLTSAVVNAALAGDHMGRAFERALKGIIAQVLAAKLAFKLLSPFHRLTEGLNLPKFFGGIFQFHQGGQVQGYANGGMIPNYHSGGTADNVPAMLQEGEFVMRRSAVESIGIENLNRMNRTGQAGGVNINFSGNVLSDSFIEEEAIPKIKKAVRRGADLGIA